MCKSVSLPLSVCSLLLTFEEYRIGDTVMHYAWKSNARSEQELIECETI
jgi:hypothetical protein